VTFDVGGEDILITNDPACFDYLSSNETVATAADGNIYAVGIGTATITGQVDTVAVEGAVTVNVGEGPEDPAPAPTVPAADVISLFSDVYADVPVDTWYAQWSVPPPPIGNVADYEVDGDNTKYYSNLTGSGYVGIVFASETIDATAAGMTHFHIDVWAPSGGVFYVKLVDFGPNGVYDQAGDDSEDELMFNGGTVPPFFSGQWSALEIPLSEFQLDAFEHLAQLIIRSTDVPMAVVDNVYFHK
jgi:hypothetical protein